MVWLGLGTLCLARAVAGGSLGPMRAESYAATNRDAEIVKVGTMHYFLRSTGDFGSPRPNLTLEPHSGKHPGEGHRSR